MASATAYVAVAAGSAIGGLARYWLSGTVAPQAGDAFPWGTLAVNVSGSLLIGVIAGFTLTDGRMPFGPTGREFLMAGVCGGYTTFSSFSLQTLDLVRDGDWRRAAANTLLSVGGCLVAVWLGHAAAVAWQRSRGV